jgi:hypothetical protein
MAQSYNKLKVPNSISHVSVDDIKSAQQSDESLAKIGEQVKSEAILVNEVVQLSITRKRVYGSANFSLLRLRRGKCIVS